MLNANVRTILVSAYEVKEDEVFGIIMPLVRLVENIHLKEDYIIPKINNQGILPFVTETQIEAIESTFKDNNTEIWRNYVDKQNAG
jgi:hypothetical protein